MLPGHLDFVLLRVTWPPVDAATTEMQFAQFFFVPEYLKLDIGVAHVVRGRPGYGYAMLSHSTLFARSRARPHGARRKESLCGRSWVRRAMQSGLDHLIEESGRRPNSKLFEERFPD